jgi:hypothetical protein
MSRVFSASATLAWELAAMARREADKYLAIAEKINVRIACLQGSR